MVKKGGHPKLQEHSLIQTTHKSTNVGSLFPGPSIKMLQLMTNKFWKDV